MKIHCKDWRYRTFSIPQNWNKHIWRNKHTHNWVLKNENTMKKRCTGMIHTIQWISPCSKRNKTYYLIMNNTGILLDKYVTWSVGISLTDSGDIRMADGVLLNFQSAQIRILSEITTWLHDENFGSNLYEVFSKKWAYTITEDDILSSISLALDPMINDGRIASIEWVNILDRTPDSIYAEVTLISWTTKWKVPLQIW